MRFLFIALALLVLANSSKSAEPSKLVVLVVFDQMRGDYLERWQKLFTKEGLGRLQRDGAWYPQCHYPYGTTQTGPGHASMLTGCCPDQHGITMNQWYDRKQGRAVNCSQSNRYERIPALPATLPAEQWKESAKHSTESEAETKTKVKEAGSPERLLVKTVGDALKEATGGKGKVVSLSFKDRSALLPAGTQADAVYWLDSADGMIVTSSCYRSAVHAWVAEFNRERVADRWFDKEWTRIAPEEIYTQNTGPDQMPGESKGIQQGITFPHPIDGGLSKPGKSYYEALFNSPFGNEMLLELVKRGVVAEKLGQDDVTDLLIISFSSNDAIGHCWGPDSHEVLDVTLRADVLMADLLAFLDKQVGAGQYTLALTADHGICPLPEYSAKKGLDAKRLPGKAIHKAAESHLREKYDPAGKDGTLNFIESVQAPWFYLNESLIAGRGLSTADIANDLAKFLLTQEGIYRTFTRAQMVKGFPLNDPLGQRMRRAYHADRSGDVAWVAKPLYLLDNMVAGTNHGSPHAYDTHVPLLFFGKGIQPGVRREAVTPQAIAAVLSRAAGIAPPETAVYPVPPRLFAE